MACHHSQSGWDKSEPLGLASGISIAGVSDIRKK